jgi:hypothetical protein
MGWGVSDRAFLLWVEGVDFDATVYDTQQLSAYRGGSLTLLQAAADVEVFLAREASTLNIAIDVSRDPGAVEPRCRIVAGASIGVLKFHAPGPAEAEGARAAVEAYLRGCAGKTEPPHAFMSYAVAVAEGDDIAAFRRVEARARARQFRRSWALPDYADDVIGACPTYDAIRPADEKQFFPPSGKLVRGDDGDLREETPTAVSKSFAARAEFGRVQRQKFYETYAASSWSDAQKSGFVFANHFQDIVADPPSSLPESAHRKLAVFYADGNRFGERYRAVASLEDYAKLSRHMRGLQSQLLNGILAWLRQGAKSSRWEAFAVRDPAGHVDRERLLGLRFETLLWGGDELTFVMPAWLALEFLELFLQATREWKALDGTRLTHGIGLVLCNVKTPIRQARSAAKALAEDTKVLFDGTKPDDLIQIEAFEGIALPEAEGGMARYRRRLYDTAGDDVTTMKLRKAVTLSRADWSGAYERVMKFRGSNGDGFSRSQIYRLLRLATKERAFSLDAAASVADAKVLTALRAYFERVGPSIDMTADDIGLPGRPLCYSLALYAVLWDYAALLPERIESTAGMTTGGAA